MLLRGKTSYGRRRHREELPPARSDRAAPANSTVSISCRFVEEPCFLNLWQKYLWVLSEVIVK